MTFLRRLYMLIYVVGSYIWTPNGTIFDFHFELRFRTTLFFDVTVFLHFWSISEGYGPRDRHSWIRLEISCRTVWSRNSGLSRRPVSCTFCFQLRPPISGEHFFEPAAQFKSLPSLVSPQHPIQHQNRHHFSKPYPTKTTKRLQTSIIFRIHINSINFLTQQHQFSPSKPGGVSL